MNEREELRSMDVIPDEVKDYKNKTSNQEDESQSIEELERKHFQRIVNVFRSYKVVQNVESESELLNVYTYVARQFKRLKYSQLPLIRTGCADYRLHSLRRLYNSMKYINSLPEHQRQLLKSYRSHLDKVRVAIEHNYEIVKVIIKDVSHLFLNADHSNDIKIISSNVSQFDMEKLQSIFKQLYREWSVEGKDERDASFKPIVDEIVLRFPPDLVTTGHVKVLVPGAGLGRLPYEIAKSGYTCQGNEFSLFMLFTSNFVLNKCQEKDLYRIYPWVHQYYNNLKSCDQIQMVRFPDVNPTDLPAGLEFSMVAGSYIEIYNEPDKWDCVATCFFLDTANNVVDYIETTWNILKPGGYWINLGPLLYHHADLPNENSIEPSYEEIRDIISKFGFIMLREEVNLSTPYSQNPRSMMSYEYKSVFFVCQKPNLSNSSKIGKSVVNDEVS